MEFSLFFTLSFSLCFSFGFGYIPGGVQAIHLAMHSEITPESAWEGGACGCLVLNLDQPCARQISYPL